MIIGIVNIVLLLCLIYQSFSEFMSKYLHWPNRTPMRSLINPNPPYNSKRNHKPSDYHAVTLKKLHKRPSFLYKRKGQHDDKAVKERHLSAAKSSGNVAHPLQCINYHRHALSPLFIWSHYFCHN